MVGKCIEKAVGTTGLFNLNCKHLEKLGGFVAVFLTSAPCLSSCQVPEHAASSCFLQAWALCVLTSHMCLLINTARCQEVRN